MADSVNVYLNRFLVRQLNEADCAVWRYNCTFDAIPEPEAIYREVGRILWAIKLPGARIGAAIATQTPIASENMSGEGWLLQPSGQEVLDPENSSDRAVLEQLARRWLEQQLRQRRKPFERAMGSGIIVWSSQNIEHAGEGWQVHKGAHLNIVIDSQGYLYLEIDQHYRFYTPWLFQDWLENYPEAPIGVVRNTYDEQTWQVTRVSEELPEAVMIPNLGISLADYHKQKGATDTEIIGSRVVYVRRTTGGSRSQEAAHLSRRLRPSISMEVLSYLIESGQPDAAKVFKSIRQPIAVRLEKSAEIASWFIKNIYGSNGEAIIPHVKQGFCLATEPLLAWKSTVARPEVALRKGCLRTGELKFGCLNLTGEANWSALVKQQLTTVSKANEVELDLETVLTQQDLPDREIARRQFWQSLAQDDIRTMLVISPWLGDSKKTQLRREALQAGIALQFMLPMINPDKYRAANITLGLLVKAGWQPVGVKMLEHEQAAEIAIGFDAGTNREMFYGTSAFAVLADGQSLGWEIPEAQPGERFSGRAIWHAVLSVVSRFEQAVGRKPRRILLMRDGFARENEFDLTIQELELEGIAVDLVEVHKSGAGRMAIVSENRYFDAAPGVAVQFDENRFRLITTRAKAGGSARPLEIVRLHGDARLGLLAIELFRLSQFHPASAFTPSRLPMPLHYADRMIKEVQRIGQIGVLHGVDRNKIFAA